MFDIQRIRSFLLDMDGTIYLGKQLFPGTIPLLNRIREKGGRYVFLTNNSSASPAEYVTRLQRFGIDAGLEDIFTSGDAAAIELTRIFGHPPKVYLLGVPALREQLAEYGVQTVNETGETPECVLLGFDKTLTYDRLREACDYIMAGVPYYATHPDFTCPVENGCIPDAGAMALLIRATTGKMPVVFGKPERAIAEAVMTKYGFRRETTCMVGDRLMTDIKFANNAEIAAVLVLSGETDMAMYNAQTDAHADFIYPSVTELCADI